MVMAPMLDISGQDSTFRLREKLTRELGPEVCACLSDPSVIEILLNADGTLWVERSGAPPCRLGSLAPLRAEAALATIAAAHKTAITRENPILECELPLDGSRFEGLIPPVVAAPVFAIRRKASAIFSLGQYVAAGMMSEGQKVIIEWAVAQRQNILIVGGTGSGKTTLVNAVIAQISTAFPEDRLVILEDTAEIQCSSENAVLLRSCEAAGLRRLLRATLRLRPDRILVGEVRGAEALDLLKAWNTGHPGGVATIHANDARAGLTRLENLVAEATPAPAQRTIAEAIHLVVCIAKTARGRRIKELVRVRGFDGTSYQTEPVDHDSWEL
jgi:type IV secretion system protein VirB11